MTEKVLSEGEILENRTTWIEALESGKYKQCEGRLHISQNDSYCCLGVAKKVLTGILPHHEYDPGVYMEVSTLLDLDGAGVNDNVFIVMNDIYKRNFKEIAAYARELFNIRLEASQEPVQSV